MQNDSGASLAETIYRKMSDEELQNTLRCETFSDGALDVKQIEMILAEMERRGINDPSRSSEEAWNEFEQEYSGKISDYADCAPEGLCCNKREAHAHTSASAGAETHHSRGNTGISHCFAADGTGKRRRCFWCDSQMDGRTV